MTFSHFLISGQCYTTVRSAVFVVTVVNCRCFAVTYAVARNSKPVTSIHYVKCEPTSTIINKTVILSYYDLVKGFLKLNILCHLNKWLSNVTCCRLYRLQCSGHFEGERMGTAFPLLRYGENAYTIQYNTIFVYCEMTERSSTSDNNTKKCILLCKKMFSWP